MVLQRHIRQNLTGKKININSSIEMKRLIRKKRNLYEKWEYIKRNVLTFMIVGSSVEI